MQITKGIKVTTYGRQFLTSYVVPHDIKDVDHAPVSSKSYKLHSTTGKNIRQTLLHLWAFNWKLAQQLLLSMNVHSHTGPNDRHCNKIYLMTMSQDHRNTNVMIS